MIIKKLCILFFLVTLCIIASNAQVETNYCLKSDGLKQYRKYIPSSKDVKRMPSFDIAEMFKEDKENENKNVPFRFGKAFETSYTLSDGKWTDASDGRLWSISFESDKAFTLNFVFYDFSLPEGACLYIENDDRTVLYGPVTSEMVPEDGHFLSGIIPGSKAHLYLFEPKAQIGKSSLKIKQVIHGYRNILNLWGQGESASCNVDVSQYSTYYNESNAVALGVFVSGQYQYLCSGSLLLSSDFSFKPYWLTAFHCLDLNKDHNLSNSEKANVGQWLFVFHFKNSSPGSGSLATYYNYYGAYFRSAWYYSDFALLELYGNLKANSTMYWLGWDKSGNTPTSGVSIHHPKGDVMKISIDNDNLVSQTFNTTNSDWLAHWEYGITQEGSSGGPLLNQNRRVVGQVHGKKYENGHNSSTPPCDMKYTSFGKFNLSWTGGGANDTHLSNWLDPIGRGPVTLDGRYYGGFNGLYNNGQSIKQITLPYPLYVLPGTNVLITSPNLIGATASYEGSATPYVWTLNNTTGTLNVGIPSTGGNTIVVHVNCTNGNTYDLQIVRNSSVYSLMVNTNGRQIEATLVEKVVDEMQSLDVVSDRSVSDDYVWEIEMYNALTREKATSQEVNGKSCIIDATGWQSGVYIMTATIGDNVLSEKVLVK